MRIIKVLLILVMISVITLAASVAYITQVLDPNDLKPTLVETAKKQQISLQLNGNITWAFGRGSGSLWKTSKRAQRLGNSRPIN